MITWFEGADADKIGEFFEVGDVVEFRTDVPYEKLGIYMGIIEKNPMVARVVFEAPPDLNERQELEAYRNKREIPPPVSQSVLKQQTILGRRVLQPFGSELFRKNNDKVRGTNKRSSSDIYEALLGMLGPFTTSADRREFESERYLSQGRFTDPIDFASFSFPERSYYAPPRELRYLSRRPRRLI